MPPLDVLQRACHNGRDAPKRASRQPYLPPASVASRGVTFNRWKGALVLDLQKAISVFVGDHVPFEASDSLCDFAFFVIDVDRNGVRLIYDHIVFPVGDLVVETPDVDDVEVGDGDEFVAFFGNGLHRF